METVWRQCVSEGERATTGNGDIFLNLIRCILLHDCVKSAEMLPLLNTSASSCRHSRSCAFFSVAENHDGE